MRKLYCAWIGLLVSAVFLSVAHGEVCTRMVPMGYSFVPYMDSGGGDLVSFPQYADNWVQLAAECSSRADCAGFTTTGYLKSSLRPGNEWSSFTSDSCKGLMVKQATPIDYCTVRIRPTTPDSGGTINLAEVTLFDRFAKQYPVSQLSAKLSSLWASSLFAGNCIDGVTNTGMCHTRDGDPNPTLNITYPCSSGLSRVIVTNRNDCCKQRISAFSFDALAADGTAFFTYKFADGSDTFNVAVKKDEDPCKKIHRACETCRKQRIPGTTRSGLVCATCAQGWRLRMEGDAKMETCDCAPGFALNGTLDNGWCAPCPVGQFCTGGGLNNLQSAASSCPEGLATVSTGAKSSTQCFTAPGYGRSSRMEGRTLVVSVDICPIGTYNTGGNTAGCQKCGTGLITKEPGAQNMSMCLAPAGSYVDRGTAKMCAKGTYTTEMNFQTACYVCPLGITTLGEGSNSSTACNRAKQGYYLINSTTAGLCPTGTYQGAEGTIYECNPCPYGWSTQADGAGGNAECMAPPGWELKPGAEQITECELGWYKQGWNKNPCLPCGNGLTTAKNGSVSADQCLVPAGWGVKNMDPLEAVMCANNTYGVNVTRAVVISSRCVPCPPNMYTRDVLMNETASQGFTAEQDCLVKPGYGIGPGGIIEMCKEGFYNTGFNRQPCRPCDTGFTSLAAGGDSPDVCVVQSGWTMDIERNIPKPCDQGYYSTGGTLENRNGVCEACPDGYSTQKDESDGPADCNVCAPGHGDVNCTICSYNTWSTGGLKEGDKCMPCAAGSVSARGARDNTQCYPDLIDADRDYFPLSDDTAWTDENATSTLECQEACRANALCVMYRARVATEQAGFKCQMLLEVANGMQVVGFKAGAGADYALYKVDAALAVGTLTLNAGEKTPQECMKACRDSNRCELVIMDAANLPSTAGPCKLHASEYDSEYIGMYHIQGNKLHSDTLIAA